MASATLKAVLLSAVRLAVRSTVCVAPVATRGVESMCCGTVSPTPYIWKPAPFASARTYSLRAVLSGRRVLTVEV